MVYHLTIDRPSDLNSSVFQARSRFRRSPGLIVADMFCLWQEIQHDAGIDLLLSQLASLQELFPGGVEVPVQAGEERHSFICQN